MLLKLYFIALPIFFAIDMIWLGLIARNFYASQIGELLKDDVNWTAAIIFYLIFIFSLLIFVVMPAMEKNSWIDALIFGALFGFVCYATYDLTNLAVLKNWPLLITIIDMAWGAFLAASVSVITFIIAKKIGL